MNEINEVIRKFGSATMLRLIYMKLADEAIAMPTDTPDECIAKAQRTRELDSLLKLAENC